MTAFHAGRVIQLAEKGLAGLDATAVLVLTVMWSFTRRDPPYYCSASLPRIARRAHLSVRAVRNAQHRLKAAGWVDWKDDPKPGVTVERILTPLPGTPAPDAGVGDAGGRTRGVPGDPQPRHQMPKPRHEMPGTPARGAANSQESVLEETEGLTLTAGRARADARHAHAVDDVMSRLGVGEDEARAWVDERLARAAHPVPPDRVAAYIAACLRNEERGREPAAPAIDPTDPSRCSWCGGGPVVVTSPGDDGFWPAVCRDCFHKSREKPVVRSGKWKIVATGEVKRGSEIEV